MAATVTINEKTVMGNQRVTFSTVTMDSAYVTGGEPVTATQLGLSTVANAICNIKSIGSTTGNVAYAVYDIANSKVLVYDEGHAQVTSADDLSSLLINITAFGK
jgi:hypothetical protein